MSPPTRTYTQTQRVHRGLRSFCSTCYLSYGLFLVSKWSTGLPFFRGFGNSLSSPFRTATLRKTPYPFTDSSRPVVWHKGVETGVVSRSLTLAPPGLSVCCFRGVPLVLAPHPLDYREKEDVETHWQRRSQRYYDPETPEDRTPKFPWTYKSLSERPFYITNTDITTVQKRPGVLPSGLPYKMIRVRMGSFSLSVWERMLVSPHLPIPECKNFTEFGSENWDILWQ